jgi:hypothetical protein
MTAPYIPTSIEAVIRDHGLETSGVVLEGGAVAPYTVIATRIRRLRGEPSPNRY